MEEQDSEGKNTVDFMTNRTNIDEDIRHDIQRNCGYLSSFSDIDGNFNVIHLTLAPAGGG